MQRRVRHSRPRYFQANWKVASYAHELFTAVADLDTVDVPIGLGSGISRVIGVRGALGLKTRVVGVVAKRANA